MAMRTNKAYFITDQHWNPPIDFLRYYMLISHNLSFSVTLSKWTVYKYINDGVFLRLTSKALPMGGKKKQEYKKVLPARVPKGTASKKGRSR